ncbi:MAG: hypothetical protein C0600_14530 [Ignavibacteria bacterium]|nr:MAG: hypothetical protein C0600_14530 [Ignavibacteria bacterium]
MHALSRLITLCLILVGIALIPACEFTTANIERATMSRSVSEESEPIEETSSFYASESTIHCSVLMANTPEGTEVKAIWYPVLEDEEKVILDSSIVTMESSGWIDFYLQLTQSNLPYGEYAVDLYVENTYEQTVPFVIEPMYPDSYIKEAVIARSINENFFPTEVTWVFDEGLANIYAPIYVSGQPEGTAFGAIWYQHDAAGDRQVIDAAEIGFDAEGWIGFSLNLPNGLPAGKYSADILLNGEVEHTLEFRAE